MRIKRYVFSLLEFDDGNESTAERVFSTFMLVLIVLNTVMVIVETFRGLSPLVLTVMRAFEVFSIALFSLEYLCRIWTADLLYPDASPVMARVKFLLSFMAVVDLLSILPFYLPMLLPVDLRALRMLRVIRLVRIFKVGRFTKSINIIRAVIREKASALFSSVLIMLILLIVAATLMYNVESTAQPDKFVNIFSGFWWAIATLTTVGYGDIYPVTGAGKLLSAIISVIGIGIVALPTSILSAGFVEKLSAKEAEEPRQYCPHCGKRLQ